MQNPVRRIYRIQAITIAWMSIEAAISLTSAWKAKSPALLAFGGDSAIELLSATAVLWRFRVSVEPKKAETRAARIEGVLLFVLAAYVAVVSILTLLGHAEPKPTFLGMGILIAAVLFMPWLSNEKRRLSAVLNSAALRADAAESALCAYLSAVALMGVGINTVWHIRWADPVAALLVSPLIMWEGQKALRGKSCECC
ncbi:MAG: cation diffusion facilitator family transporter [Candidatus Sulfotelmatobacter sp.]